MRNWFLLAEKLPVLDLTWPDELQARWWKLFERLWARARYPSIER
jgi:hypothetical protein